MAAGLVINVMDLVVSNVVSNLGSVGGVIGKGTELIGGTGGAYTKQIAEYGRISAMYILYRAAEKQLYGQPRALNNFIYSL